MRRATVVLLSVALAASGVGAQEQGPRLAMLQSVAVDFPISAQRVLDVDGDGRDDVLLIGRDGEVRVLRANDAGELQGPFGSLVLPRPERTLLDVGDVLGSAGEGRSGQLVAMSPEGLLAYAPGPDGGYTERAVVLAAAPRFAFSLRLGAPRFADVVRDINGDGRQDVVLPSGDYCALWLAQEPRAGRPPRFRRTASVVVDMRRIERHYTDEMTDVLESTFRIPDVSIEDVNGDGRRDLVVADGKLRAFHMQRADGVIPAEADVSVDLDIFQDTTPKAAVKLGRTLAGGDRQRMQTADLDGDGIPDYVIGHRRKVWVFHGTSAGPQFTDPSCILKVAEDITTLLLLELDGNDYTDLVLLRVQVPTAAALIRGLLAEWDVELSGVGYANLGGRKFDTKPGWRSELEVTLPALLGVIRDPENLIRKFEDVASRFGAALEGDLDHDGRGDVALVVTAPTADTADGAEPAPDTIEIWRGSAATSAANAADEGASGLARLFFDEQRRSWDLEDILAWLGSQAERRAARVTGGRAADAAIDLRGDDHERLGVHAARLRGDGSSALVVIYSTGQTGGVVDVVGVTPVTVPRKVR